MKGTLFQLFILEALCAVIVIFRPVYSHPHSTSTTRYKVSFEDTAAKLMHASIDTAHFSRHFPMKRQASDLTADEKYCHIQFLDIWCSSGFYQLVADAHFACGESDFAPFYANLCAQNEMGEYCDTLYYKLENVDPDLDYVNGKCSPSLSSGSCHANCRAQLQLLKDKLGCCPLEYFNITASYMSRHRPVFDLRLWNLCNIPLSNPPCRIPHISQGNQKICTESDEDAFRNSILCQPRGVGQSIVSKIFDNKQCSQVYALFNSSAQSLVGRCFRNPRGEYCGPRDGHYGSLSSTVYEIDTHCSSSDEGGCNQTCTDTLVEAKRTLGCCINRYNNSVVEPEYISVSSYQAAVSYDLWNSCGVELGTCESTLSFTPSGSTSLMQSGITIWIVVALLVLI